ncbi:MAG: class I SAM-dependent methyltransferase [Mycobacteriaceae bacterium]
MTLGQIVEALSDGPLGLRFTAYDGSSAGPADAPIGLHLASPRGTTYLATAPTDPDLGMARAYISGDLTLSGVHPGDPYEALVAMADGMKLHRPPALSLASIMRSLGWETLRPVAPPPQEALPKWRRAAHGLRHSKTRDAEAIHSHYDVSNAFYEHVLGDSMTYTCAYYSSVDASVGQAQEDKYQLVFDKLGLKAGDRLLDVGCGWGGMVRFAARRGVHAIGATLSKEQADWARAAIEREGLGDLAEVRHSDYRDVTETGFTAVSSIGLTEHIGIAQYPAYFRFIMGKLAPGGRLLNHCITRPGNDRRTMTGSFIDRYVFPDGELIGSGTIIAAIQDAGLEVRHEENLREHYALTLRDWCANLVANWDACVAEVGESTAKLWGLYMAGSRLGFDRNVVQLHQVLAVKLTATGDAQVPLRQWWGAGV